MIYFKYNIDKKMGEIGTQPYENDILPRREKLHYIEAGNRIRVWHTLGELDTNVMLLDLPLDQVIIIFSYE